MTTYYKSLDRGYPGSISRSPFMGETLKAEVVGAEPVFCGDPVSLEQASGDTVFTLVPCNTAARVATLVGFLVREFPTQQMPCVDSDGYQFEGKVVSVMQRGLMTVRCTAGTPALKGAVYVKTANGTDDSPVGSIVADATDATVIPNTYFNGDADADGITEIACNI